MVDSRRTVTGSWVAVTANCNASPDTWVTLMAGMVVPCTPARNTGGPGWRSNRTAASAPAFAALVILTAGRQLPVGMRAIAPSNPPAGNAVQPVSDPTSSE